MGQNESGRRLVETAYPLPSQQFSPHLTHTHKTLFSRHYSVIAVLQAWPGHLRTCSG